MVFLISDEPVPPHKGQFVGKRAALYAEVIRQLLAIVGDVKAIASAALDAFRKIGEQPLADGLGACVQHPAGELQIFLRAERQQVPHEPHMVRTDPGAGLRQPSDVQQQRLRILGGGHIDHQRLARYTGIRFRKDTARADAVQNAVIAPHVPHLNDDPAGQHHAEPIDGRPLRKDDLSFFIGMLFCREAAEHFLNVRRLHSAEKPCVCQMNLHIFHLFVGVPTDDHDL